MKNIILLAAFLLVDHIAFTQTIDFSAYDDATEPLKFFPGQISVDGIQWNNTFDHSEKTIFLTQQLPNRAQLVYSRYSDKGFSGIEVLPFDTSFIYSDPWLAPDGQSLVFMSTMPVEMDGETKTGFNLWKSLRQATQWSDPLIFSENLVMSGSEGYPCLTDDGTIYFSNKPDNSRNADIYFSKLKNGEYSKPVRLPDNVNSSNFEGDAFVNPKNEYIIFAAFNRVEGHGLSDMFISFNLGENKWTDPKHLGSINSEGYDGSPYVTRDGQFLIFTSSRNSPEEKIHFNHYIVRFDARKYR